MVGGDLHKIKSLLGDLKDREREIIIARYGLKGKEKKTLEAIGEIYGATRVRIR